MGLKRLSDVAVGEVITIGGTNYKVDTKSGDHVLVCKQVAPGIYESQKRGIGALVTGYEGAKYHMVNVVEQKKNDLTSQLRAQVKTQSLTESLRAQVSQSSDEDEVDYDDEGDWDPAWDEEDGELEEIIEEVAEVAEQAKQSALTANLRAQQTQQSLFNAHTKINDVSKGIAGLNADVNKGFADVSGRVTGLSFEVDQVARDVHHVANVANDAVYRVAKLEQKQIQEEKKMSLQNELNAKLAAKKAQSDLQAQLDSKLNQKSNKTTGGNGTMKNLFGAFKNQFGKVEGKFAFSIATGGLALRKGISANFVAFEPATKAITDVTGLTLDFNVPAFKLPTAADEVKVGDIVLNGADFGYVTKVNDGYVEVVNPEKNANGSVLPTTNPIFGKAFYTVVKTLDAAGQGGFNPALLLALGDGNKDELVKIMALTGGFGGAQGGTIDPTMLMLLGDNVDELLPLLLMQQGGVGAQGFNPLMMLALSDKGGSKDKLLPLLMMQGQQGGAINPMMMLALGDGELDLTTLALMGGFNGQGGLFGGAPAAPKTVQGTDAE